MFDALAKLSATVPSAYHRASEYKDLHLGDLHLIEITGQLLFLTFLCLEFILSYPANYLLCALTKEIHVHMPARIDAVFRWLLTCHISWTLQSHFIAHENKDLDLLRLKESLLIGHNICIPMSYGYHHESCQLDMHGKFFHKPYK